MEVYLADNPFLLLKFEAFHEVFRLCHTFGVYGVTVNRVVDTKAIKPILELMKRYDLAEVEIEKEGSRILLRRNAPMSTVSFPPGASGPVSQPADDSTVPPATSAVEEPGVSYITSPMVGTFYSAPAPDEAAFIKIGAKVSTKTEVCIIEAMKIMNRIEAGVSGEIVEILADNGEPVEYGRPLFKVKTV